MNSKPNAKSFDSVIKQTLLSYNSQILFSDTFKVPKVYSLDFTRRSTSFEYRNAFQDASDVLNIKKL